MIHKRVTAKRQQAFSNEGMVYRQFQNNQKYGQQMFLALYFLEQLELARAT